MKIKLLAISALLIVNSAQAALIDKDTYITDTLSGLDWLKLPQTMGLSVNQVKSEMVTGGAYEGWRFASHENFGDMLINEVGSYAGDGNTIASAEKVAALISIFGVSENYQTNDYSVLINYGILGEPTYFNPDPTNVDIVITYFDVARMISFMGLTDTSYNEAFITDYFDTISDDDDYSYVGSYLVRNSAVVSSVPLPPSLALFAFGSVGLFLFGKKKTV